MNLFRGDVHKIYCHLKKNPNNIKTSKYLRDVQEVYEFYETVESDTLKFIYYRLIKENNGSGMIPMLISTIPFLLMILSDDLKTLPLMEGRNWLFFIFIYLIALSFFLFVHFRERAWASSHIEIIQDILKERKDN